MGIGDRASQILVQYRPAPIRRGGWGLSGVGLARRMMLPALLLVTAACTPMTVSSTGPTPTYAPPTLAPLETATPTATRSPTPRPTATFLPAPPAPCTEESGTLGSGSYFSQVLGREMVYLVYLPPCYGHYEQAYPVLYLLHGYPYDERHWDRLGADEVADNGIRSGAYPPFLMVMPNCGSSPSGVFVSTSGGDMSVEGLIVNELIPHVDRTYRTWAAPEGRAIGGVSRGGVWSLEIAFRHPDLFATAGGHSAALAVNQPHPAYDPYNLAAEPAVRELRIWLDAGDGDWARGGVEQLCRILQENGAGPECVIGEGSHSDEYWSRMLPAYLAFYTADWRSAP